ncbi:MAG: hypothetical protein WCF18_00300, partial [Chthoniobacteraceae bacterium]
CTAIESQRRHDRGQIIVTGWDSEEEVLDRIENGWIYATSVLNSSLATQIAFGLLEAQRLGYLYPKSLQIRELSFPPVPREILLAQTPVDRTSVEAYRRKRGSFNPPESAPR